jgi:putative sterol carrier protein
MLQSLTERFQARASGAATLGSAIKFRTEQGVVVLDASQSPTRIHNDDVEVPCTIDVAAEDLDQILNGSLDATAAFMMGRLRVEGDMAVAMKLSAVLRG